MEHKEYVLLVLKNFILCFGCCVALIFITVGDFSDFGIEGLCNENYALLCARAPMAFGVSILVSIFGFKIKGDFHENKTSAYCRGGLIGILSGLGAILCHV